jgi:hypothetical protein
MKIKEKGLTGKGANHRRELLSSQKFDAFREMAKDNASSKKKAAENKDVFLEFLGHKILVKKDEEGHGVVDEKDIPFVKGVTLKFDGCGGDVTWSEIKVKLPVFLFRTSVAHCSLLILSFLSRIRSEKGLMVELPISNTPEAKTAVLWGFTNLFRKKTSNL